MPIVHEYAYMAAQAYQPNGGAPPAGWAIMDYAAPVNRWGFRVAVYRNPATRNIVISFMGTQEPIQHFGNIGLATGHVPPQQGDAEEKVKQVLRASAAMGLAEAAQQILPPTFLERFFTFIGKAIAALLRGDRIDKALSEFLREEAEGIRHSFDTVSPGVQEAITRLQEAAPGHRISITGHSLGGCIAELCAARFGLAATTFDSPGSRELIAADPRYGQPDYSHITSYLAAPNVVNTLYGRVGTYHCIFIPFVPEGWTWEHAGKSVFASTSRVGAYVFTFFSGGAGAPLAGAAAAGTASFVMGGISAASTFGIVPTSEDFRRQHSINNIVEAVASQDHPPVLMHSWPKLSEIQWASFFTALRALAPLPGNSPGIRTMFDQNSMIEAQIRELDGYVESAEGQQLRPTSKL